MGFEDIFENKRKFHGDHLNRNYPENIRNTHDSRYPYYRRDDGPNWSGILMKIRNNKKLRLFVILAAILVIAIAVVLIIVLMPLILKLFNYISQNGLQGLLDNATALLDKILKGSPK
jgi:hypothetical protein